MSHEHDESWTRCRRRYGALASPRHSPSQQLPTAALLYATLVEPVPISVGIAAAEADRIGLHGGDADGKRRGHLTYGEIEFAPFATSIARIRAVFGGLGSGDGGARRGVFYDLGSGTGKAVFTAALVHRFERCVGIELLESLHVCAQRLKARWNAVIAPQLERPSVAAERGGGASYDAGEGEDAAAALKMRPVLNPSSVRLICGDIFDVEVCDWAADASLCFCATTCFDRPLMERLVRTASRCSVGTWFITWTKELAEFADRMGGEWVGQWKTRSVARHVMSWGKKVTVYIQEKVR